VTDRPPAWIDLSADAVLTTSDGRSGTVAEWCRKTGLTVDTMRQRFKAGKTIDQILTPGTCKAKDMTGQVFGRLRVLERGDIPYSTAAYWRCLCDPDLGGCGKVAFVRGGALRAGQIKSCGCLRRERRSPDAMTPQNVVRMKARGLVRFNAWVYPEDKAEMSALAARLRAERKSSGRKGKKP
jgi:hypothetical protein